MRNEIKISDLDIIQLNSIGLKQGTIGKIAGVHQTAITNRLHKLGVAPCDTRRSFMEDVFFALTPATQEWLKDQLGPQLTIKQLVSNLIEKAHYDQARP